MKENNIFGFFIGTMMILITIIAICILVAIENMRIDHKCYMMEDEEFFQTEMCKPYWRYRQVGKK